jgi:hypothetical protein
MARRSRGPVGRVLPVSRACATTASSVATSATAARASAPADVAGGWPASCHHAASCATAMASVMRITQVTADRLRRLRPAGHLRGARLRAVAATRGRRRAAVETPERDARRRSGLDKRARFRPGGPVGRSGPRGGSGAAGGGSSGVSALEAVVLLPGGRPGSTGCLGLAPLVPGCLARRHFEFTEPLAAG